ncbi:hypothetical protein ACHAXN_010242 [Cyclotella atomus]
MSSIDGSKAAKRAKEKKKKSKKSKKHSDPIDGFERSHASSSGKKSSDDKSQTSDDIDMAENIAERKKGRRLHNLASSGMPKQPPELEYGLDAPKTEKTKKKKHQDIGELKSPPEDLTMESPSAASMPGAKFERIEDTSQAERVKYGHVKPASADSSGASMPVPGVRQESSEDLSPAERTKFGYSKKGSVDSIPGAKQSSFDDLTPAERTKFGYSKKGSADSTPGAKKSSFDDLTPAEKTKFGYSKRSSKDSTSGAKQSSFDDRYKKRTSFDSDIASMPGARQENNEDVSQAERLKHGYHKSSSTGPAAASMPGSRQESNEDSSSTGPAAASMPGPKHQSVDDVSEAERLKYGSQKTTASPSTDSSKPGAKQESSLEISQAERLKYGLNTPESRQGSAVNDSRRVATPGAMQGDDSNTSEAERIKFGLRDNFAGRDNESVNSVIDEEEEDEIDDGSYDEREQNSDADIEANNGEEADHRHSHRSSGKSKSRYRNFARSSLRQSFMSDFSEGDNPDLSEKREVDIWRPCCQICTAVSFVIIIALSASLGVANKRAAASSVLVVTSTPAEVIASTAMPTVSPSLSPTTSPDDYAFCYEQNEFAMLSNARYSSLRSKLVASRVSTSNEFSDMSSYQRKALCWLAFGDRLGINATDPFLEQRYVLSTVYFGLNESQTLLDNGWLSGKSECQWHPMVQCDSRTDSTVTKLSLTANNLIGELPKELGYLQDTTYLDVGMNQLRGDVTDAIGSWSNLLSLGLGSNEFTAIPDLTAFPSLKNLDMSGNGITGLIPESLASNTNLEYLDLSANGFEETIPTILGELKSLQSLYIYLNGLRGSVPEEVCALRDLDLNHLAVDCGSLGGEVECQITCCTACYPNVPNQNSPFVTT